MKPYTQEFRVQMLSVLSTTMLLSKVYALNIFGILSSRFNLNSWLNLRILLVKKI